MARGVGIFQALVALPAMVILGEWALEALFYTNMPIYDFITATFNSLFAAAIIFIVFVQLNTSTSTTVTFYFEVAKSSLATALWLWLLLDAIFEPGHWNSPYPRPPKGPRIARAAISVVVLLILFYPILIYSKIEEKRSRNSGADPEANQAQEQAGERGEREPLLG